MAPTIGSIITTVILAFFVFGAYKFVSDTEISDELKNNIVTEFQKNPVLAFIFVKSLDDLTPTLNLPITEKRIFMITEFPVFSWWHLLVIIVLIVVAGFIMRWKEVNILYQLLVYLGLVVLGYILASVILYVLYLISAKAIGFSLAEAKEIRITYDNHLDNVALPLIMFSLLSALVIIKTIYHAMFKKK